MCIVHVHGTCAPQAVLAVTCKDAFDVATSTVCPGNCTNPIQIQSKKGKTPRKEDLILYNYIYMIFHDMDLFDHMEDLTY